MNILITGTSKGIGRSTAIKFLNEGHIVYGIDRLDSSIDDKNYKHYKLDIRSKELPKIDKVDILILNAGTQDESEAIDVNLFGTVNVADHYIDTNLKDIKSILFIISAAARNGSEFKNYVISKGGLLPYMKKLALDLGKYSITVNSISPGAVATSLNQHILDSSILYEKVKDETILKKWAYPEEIAEWSYFITVINKSMTGEDILIDNGEILRSNFIW